MRCCWFQKAQSWVRQTARWVYAGWAQPDHTHLTGEGYRALADALLADLLSSYDSYRKAHGLSLTDTTTTHASPTHASTHTSPANPIPTPELAG